MDEGPTLMLNGKPCPVVPGTTVLALLEGLQLAGVPVLVEHNGTALFPREFPVTSLCGGDRVEIIRIVAGG